MKKNKINKGVTLNLGDYQSYRIDIGMETDEEDYKKVKKWVEDKLDKEIDDSGFKVVPKEEGGE